MFEMVPFMKRNSLSKMFDQMDSNFLNNFFSDDFLSSNITGFKTDIVDTGNSYLIEAELPGFDKDDIAIETSDNYLTITAKKSKATDDKTDNYIRKERHYGEVTRSFRLDNVKESEIMANYSNGILRLTLPKQQQPETKSRKIDIT